MVYANSEYYNFSQQLLNVDKTITKENLANLMTWAGTEIKYKQTLQELSSLIAITYKDIIECSKQLHFMIN